MIVPCELEAIENTEGYKYSVTKQSISPSVDEVKFQNQINNDEFDTNVKFLLISQCTIPKFPREINNDFRHLEKLTIMQSQLKSITKFELKSFKNLKIVNFNFNDLAFLPGDLFHCNMKLEEIHFKSNKIEYIGPKLIESLQSLTYADFRDNKNINKYLSINEIAFYGNYGFRVTLEGLMEIIHEKCAPPIDENELAARYGMRNGGNYPGNHAEHQLQITPHSFIDDMQNFFMRGEFKDFTVKVADREFKIYKSVLAARSKTFTEYLRNNPEAVSMDLLDITAENFDRVMKFVQFERQPYTENVADVFIAAGKLEIEGLKTVTANLMIASMKNEKNLENLLKILSMANDYEHDELRLKAFEEIKKQFPGSQLKDELARQPEKLKRIIDVKLMLMKELEN